MVSLKSFRDARPGGDFVFKFHHSSIAKQKLGEDHVERIRLSLLGSWVLVVGMSLLVPFSWAQGQSHATVVKATKQAFAPPLSQMVPIPLRPSSLSDDDRMPIHPPRATSPARDSVLQESTDADLGAAVSTLSANSGLNILGLGYGFTGYSQQASQPDTNAAVGPTQIVQWVNESFVVLNKSNGSVLYGPANGNTLWQALGGPCANDNLDPIAQFDKLANRWVMLMPIFGPPSALLCVAVSTTSDATNGGWNLYAFPIPGNQMPDYPKLTVWPDAYYVTYNQGRNLVFIGAAACALDRNSMLTGGTAAMQCFTNIATSYGSLLSGDLDGTTPPPAGAPNYFLNFDANDQSLDLWQFHVDWTTPSASTFTGPTNIPVAAFTEACGETILELNYTTGACVPQKGTTEMLDSYGDRVMYRLAYRNFGSSQALLVNHTVTIGTSSSQTGIRWYELQNTGTGFGLYQQGTYAPDSNYRWMGSIAMDKLGDIGLGYSVSSSTMSPSIRYTGRVPSDPLGTMETELDVLAAAGAANGSQTNTFHWGDYSSMVIDPTDDCTFWYTTEYQSTLGNRWATRIASFSFPSCTSTTQNTLTVNQVGQGTVTSTDGEISCTNGSGTCSAVYSAGSSVTLNASAAGGWTLSGWSGACSGSNPCNVVMNSNLGPIATFTSPNYTLTVNDTGSGTVTSSDGIINCTNGGGTCRAIYASASSVTLNATAATHGTFSGWSGSCSGTNPCNIVMNGNLSATAAFSTPNYTLAVKQVGQGTVTSTDGKINCTNGSGSCSAVYAAGSSVTMNASAASGWSFSGWSGACSGSNPCKLVISRNMAPTATFTAGTTNPSWAIVNKGSNFGNPITSLTIPATGTGNLIAIAMMFNGTTSVASVSDSAGNTYVSAHARATKGILSTEIWYAVNSNSGATVVTPNFVGSPTHVEITEWEVSGLSTSPPDAASIASGSVVSNNTAGPAVTTTQTGDFIVSALFANSASFTSITTGNEFTDDFTTDGNGWAHITSTSGAAGMNQASWYTPSPVGVYCASTVAFLPN
jgi:hypothetical protein